MDVDETDRKILYLLQDENRTTLTHSDIADRIGVSSSTVSNRLNALKDDGILVDYVPVINYEEMDIPHHLLFVCTAPIAKRKELAAQTIDIHRVVCVRELLTGKQNLHVEVVCSSTATIENVAEELDELGLEIEHSEILRREYRQPFNDFGVEAMAESDDE